MIKKATFIAVAATALAGCVLSSGTRYHVVDPYLFFDRAARGGQFPVVVIGEPFPGKQPYVEAAIIDAMNRQFPRAGGSFGAVQDAGGLHSRYVVVFNAPGRPLAQSICANTASIAPGVGTGAGDTIYASAAYCGDGPYSSSWVSFPNPGSPDSPEFHDAMMRLVMESIPREPDPNERKGNDPKVP